MGWDVVEIGLKHNLPVNNPFATAEEVAKRMKKNAKHILFSSYFQNQLNLSGEDFVEVIYDDFCDIDNS